MIDNYDSYVYNLVSYMKELEMNVQVVRNDDIDWGELEIQMQQRTIKGIILSPGPKHPKDFTYAKKIIGCFSDYTPILGVCLGHQMIADTFGAGVTKAPRPMHGKLSKISHFGNFLFEDIPNHFTVTRYHSLVVSENDFPKELEIDAKSEDGMIMAIHHKEKPIFGIQFHPEAVLTQYGHELLKNYKNICERWALCQHI
jgi:para-aminobenzoate synthetase component 2